MAVFPMNNGGLGLRDLDIMIKSMVAMVAWRIIKNPDSLIAKILKAKYFSQFLYMETQL